MEQAACLQGEEGGTILQTADLHATRHVQWCCKPIKLVCTLAKPTHLLPAPSIADPSKKLPPTIEDPNLAHYLTAKKPQGGSFQTKSPVNHCNEFLLLSSGTWKPLRQCWAGRNQSLYSQSSSQTVLQGKMPLENHYQKNWGLLLPYKMPDFDGILKQTAFHSCFLLLCHQHWQKWILLTKLFCCLDSRSTMICIWVVFACIISLSCHLCI